MVILSEKNNFLPSLWTILITHYRPDMEIYLMFIKSFNKLLKEYYQHRFVENSDHPRKRGKSAILLRSTFNKFESEFLKNPAFNGLSIDLSDGTGNLAKNPFFRIYHPHVSPSGKRGFYVAVSFFTTPKEERLMISITKGKEDSDKKSEAERKYIEDEVRKASLEFEKTHFSNQKIPAGITLISKNKNKASVAVASKTILAKDLAKKDDDDLIKIIVYLCGVYREYIDQCFISEGLPDPQTKDKKALVRIRRAHNKFRKEVSMRCKNTCVITGCKLLDICDAAHIVPYSEWTGYDPNNGLLMRADMHRLFDKNKIIIEENGNIMINDKKIKSHYSGIIHERIGDLRYETKEFLRRRHKLIS